MTVATLKLWEVGDELTEIAGLIMEAGGELSEELEERLAAMEGAFEEKVERIALKIREMEANAEAAKAEAARLARIQKTFANTAKRMTEWLHYEMGRANVKRVGTHRVKVWVQNNGRPSIRWTRAVEDAPAAYRKTVTTVSVDTQAAYEAWKEDEELPEGFTVERGTHLRIG